MGMVGTTTISPYHSDAEDSDSEKDSGVFPGANGAGGAGGGLLVPKLQQRRLSISTFTME